MQLPSVITKSLAKPGTGPDQTLATGEDSRSLGKTLEALNLRGQFDNLVKIPLEAFITLKTKKGLVQLRMG